MKLMSLTVRPAGADDLAQVHRVVEAAYEGYVARIGGRPAPMDADYAALVERGEVWVAEEDNAVVGVLVLRISDDAALLENVAVRPDRQRAGIGTRLIRLAEAMTLERGLRGIDLYTNAAMTENLEYYRRLGFEETRRAVEGGFDRVYLTRRLD